MIEPGAIIGSYRIQEEVGLGGMGKVYRGIDLMLSREVAIKVLRPEMTQYGSLVERFRNEAVVLAKLNHPHIALLYNLIQQDNLLFMVMEFLRGDPLDWRIRKSGAIPYGEAIRLFGQILEAINYAHQNGVVHRDLKPNNIMITPGEKVKVMDFGIARVLGTQRMTMEGSVIGTVEYMAPEQVRGQESSERTDIYSLGILLYEMLCGKLPFTSDNQYDLMRAQIESPPPPPRTIAPMIPEHVEQAILRALAKEPAGRFASALEFRKALKIGEQPLSPDAPTSTHRVTIAPGHGRDTEYIQPGSEAVVGRNRETEPLDDDVRQRMIDEARRQGAKDAEEERRKLIQEARRQAEQEAARFAEEERRRLVEEARKEAEQEAARLAEEERGRLIEEARRQAEHEASQRAHSERLRLVEASRKRAEHEAAQRAVAERQRLVEEARKRAEFEAAHLAAAERQRLIEEARKQAEQEAARLAEEEMQRLVEEARKQAEQEAAKYAEEERRKLIEEAHKWAEQEAATRASAERKRLIEDARKHAEIEAATRAAAERERLIEEARKLAEQEAAQLGAEESQRLFEQAIHETEQEVSQLAAEERRRLIEEARKRAEQEAAQRASKERQRLVERARKQAGEEAAKLAEEERERLVEEAIKQAEQEAAHLAEEERHQLLEEARKKAEKEAARRAAKDRKRIIAEERKRAKQEARRQSAELLAHPDPYGTSMLSDPALPDGSEPSSRRLPAIIGVALLAGIAIVAFFYSRRGGGTEPPPQVPIASARPDLVRISGGTFSMGRDYPKQPGEDDEWAERQIPAHAVTVQPFEMDRTEVKNAEYARFIREANHRPPADWGGNEPPRGQEQWPVRNVSLDDARAFAAWRTQRDGVAYRLPTEAEWEFAAKGQSNHRYPWGNDWSNDRANVAAESPKPVGSYQQSASPFGVLDLLGNVGEWTSSQASIYPGNQRANLDAESVSYFVVRGGNYGSSPTGAKPITVTARGFAPRSYQDPNIGFRLVRQTR
ncbi:MAG: protein kinase domain-containing protein [Blastocatellia bacterium]